MHQYVPYILLLPLVGFLVNGLFGRKIASEKLAGAIGSGVIGLSFALAVMILAEMLQAPADERKHVVTLFQWIAAGSLGVNVSYQVDQLSILMTLVVTGVGFLIHVYSIGYMHGDPGFRRFFAYMNLFIFMMLNLVLAGNFLLMFLGWEGVGLCSYLLIGFWHDRAFDTGGYAPGKAMTTDAAKKAFVVNRIGDFGFLIAMFMIVGAFGTLNFEEVFARAPYVFEMGSTTVFWITLLLFLGATGKSAQIPLFVWLPDAMAGPTPVSALIHAATMVTAGVYMIARCSILFVLAPATMEIVAVIGLATALVAATIGLVQNDIKKVLAYSTVSQLGYMFLALGVGSFTGGVFHVMTHAFFKALLFLGAGSVIHAMHEEQDIQKMGGLARAMPATYRTFLVAALAIAGIPPLSGFFSKDEILWKAFSQGGPVFWVIGWMVAGLTAFYMFRLVSLTFGGEARYAHDKHPHESPRVMTVPLMILAVLSVVGGFLGVPESLGGSNSIEHWLDPVFAPATERLSFGTLGHDPTEYVLMALSVLIAVGAIYAARGIFLKKPSIADAMASRFRPVHAFLWNKYFVDDLYEAVIVRPIQRGSEIMLWKWFDVGVIDRLVNGSASAIDAASGVLKKVQTGGAQSYAYGFVFGIIIVLGVIIFS